jgi:hypothetical protein
MNTYKIKMIDKATGEVFYVELKTEFALRASRIASKDFPGCVVETVSKVK